MTAFEAMSAQIASPRATRSRMAWILAALVPGVLACVIWQGAGVLIQMVLAAAFALALEASMLKLRGQPMSRFLTDLSAPLTAVLFALSVPPLAPWWIAAVGMVVAIVFVKQLYGGLGYNVFNPAMAGVAVVMLCFPGEFSLRPPLAGQEWLASAYALGGLLLLRKKIIPWQTPVATLTSVIVLTLLPIQGPGIDAISLPQVFPGALMLAAFFIVTDPVTGCAYPRGRLLFGAGVGVLTVLIRRWSSHPEGLAFAVLLMNGAAAWIDLHTRPAIAGKRNQRLPS